MLAVELLENGSADTKSASRRRAWSRTSRMTAPMAERSSGTSVCAPMTTGSWLGKIPSAGAARKPAARSLA